MKGVLWQRCNEPIDPRALLSCGGGSVGDGGRQRQQRIRRWRRCPVRAPQEASLARVFLLLLMMVERVLYDIFLVAYSLAGVSHYHRAILT